MNNFSDEVLARRLLARREQGYSLSLYLRQNNKSYSIFFTYFTFLIIGLGVLQFWIPFRIAPVWIAVTCVASCLLRDLSWVLGTVRVWQFTSKVIDWDKVYKLAEEKPVVH